MAELVDAIQIVCGTLLISSLIMPVLLQPFESCRRGDLTGWRKIKDIHFGVVNQCGLNN